MEITEVRIKLIENAEDRLRAFCSITFDDCFVVRDLKIIEGNNGAFVAMPSRKLTTHCRECHAKNHLRARFCNQCGKRIGGEKIEFDYQGRAKLYADIAHPINATCREQIQNRVINEFYSELERAKQPGYESRYDDDYDTEDEQWEEPAASKKKTAESSRSTIHDSAKPVQGPHNIPRDQPKEKSEVSPPDSTAGQPPSSSESRKTDPVSDEGNGGFGHGIF